MDILKTKWSIFLDKVDWDLGASILRSCCPKGKWIHNKSYIDPGKLWKIAVCSTSLIFLVIKGLNIALEDSETCPADCPSCSCCDDSNCYLVERFERQVPIVRHAPFQWPNSSNVRVARAAARIVRMCYLQGFSQAIRAELQWNSASSFSF